jgi:hypothetical protein
MTSTVPSQSRAQTKGANRRSTRVPGILLIPIADALTMRIFIRKRLTYPCMLQAVDDDGHWIMVKLNPRDPLSARSYRRLSVLSRVMFELDPIWPIVPLSGFDNIPEQGM